MIVYPDLATLRKFYSGYVQKHLEERNELVVVAPFYETIDSLRESLSKRNINSIDIQKYEKDNQLVIVDSLKIYYSIEDDASSFVKKILSFADKMDKNGVSLIEDMGAFHYKQDKDKLVNYEMSLSTNFQEDKINNLCLYHQKDFDNLGEDRQQKLIEYHGIAIELVEQPTRY